MDHKRITWKEYGFLLRKFKCVAMIQWEFSGGKLVCNLTHNQISSFMTLLIIITSFGFGSLCKLNKEIYVVSAFK